MVDIIDPIEKWPREFGARVVEYVDNNLQSVINRFGDGTCKYRGTACEMLAIEWLEGNGISFQDDRQTEGGHDFILDGGIPIDVKHTACKYRPKPTHSLNVNDVAAHTCDYYMGYAVQTNERNHVIGSVLVGFISHDDLVDKGRYFEKGAQVSTRDGRPQFKANDPLWDIEYKDLMYPHEFLTILFE